MPVRIQTVLTHKITDHSRHGFYGFHLSTQGRTGCLTRSREFLAVEDEVTEICLGGGDIFIFPTPDLVAFVASLTSAGHLVVLEVPQVHLGTEKLDKVLAQTGVQEILVGLHCFSEAHLASYVAAANTLRDSGVTVTPCIHVGRTEVSDAYYLRLKDERADHIVVRYAHAALPRCMKEWQVAHAKGDQAKFKYDRRAAKCVGAETTQPLTLHYDAVSQTFSDEIDGERFPVIPGHDSLVAVEYLIVADDPELSQISWRKRGEGAIPTETIAA